MNELTAHVSPNPIFTALLQEDPPESAARQLFGQLEAGHALGHLMAPGIVHDPVPAGEAFPYRASLAARMIEQGIVDAASFQAGAGRLQDQLSAPPAIPPPLVENAGQMRQPMTAALYRAVGGTDPVVLAGLISTTATGSINLRLRKALDQ